MRGAWVPLLCLFLLGALAGCGEVPAPGGAAEPRAEPEATKPQAGPNEVLVGSESNGQDVAVPLGHVLKVSLPGNPSTGFSWGVAQVDSAFLQQDGEVEFTPSSGTLGAGGQQILRFKTLQAGSSTLVLEYRRSWETGVAPQEVFSIQVVVR